MNKPLTVILAVVVVAVIAVVAYGLIDGDRDGTNEDDSTIDSTGSIFTGPYVNNIEMGSLEPVTDSYDISDPENPTITYRAVAKEGFQFLYWTDSEGNYLTDNPSMTFPAEADRDAIAEFAEGGTRSVEIEWYMPVFGADGVTFGNEPERMNISISSYEWYDSVTEKGTQRQYTISNPSPVALLTSENVVADIVGNLNGYVSGLTNLQKAMVVLAFVQDAIDYETDWNLYDREEFWAAPMESLFLGYGDCEDGAILFVSIASAMGIDCGFVTFDSDVYGTEGSGHMSVAIALEDDEHITGENVATFTIDGVTYAYGETSVDPALIGNVHPMFGILGESYSIMSAKWTHVDYADGEFTAGSTLTIGGRGMPAGHVIYGDAYTNPPAVPMEVGDSFVYQPETTLPAEYVVTGDGLVENGGFLVWDAATQTLSGTAVEPGSYNITLNATSTVGPAQTAVQYITVFVSDSTSDEGHSDHYLIYGDGAWSVETETVPDTDDADDGSEDNTILLIVGGAFVVILGMIIVGRVI